MTTREEAQRLADALERVNGEYDRDKETVSDAVQLLRQWPEAGEPGWMTIESAPKDGGMFLVWIAGVRHGETDEGQPYQQEEGQVDFAQWRTFEDGGYVDCFGNPYPYDQWGATHWMPLPAAPGAAQPAPAQQPDATPVSGSTHGLSQDYNGKLGKWFADRPGARQQLREDMAQAEQSGMVMVPREPTHEMLYAMAELDGWRKGDRDHPMFTRWEDYWNAALAAAPQAVSQLQPLTDMQLLDVYWQAAWNIDGKAPMHSWEKEYASNIIRGLRAVIAAAHGITAKGDGNG